MNRSEKIPVIIVTAVLLIYSFLVLSGLFISLTEMIFMISPFLVIWLVYNVIRYGEFKGQELKEDEEWGYADRPRDNSGNIQG